MTAVAVRHGGHSPHHSRTQNYTAMALPHGTRQGDRSSSAGNGTPNSVGSRQSLNNGTAVDGQENRNTNGISSEYNNELSSAVPNGGHSTNNTMPRDLGIPEYLRANRTSSANSSRTASPSPDDSDLERRKRRPRSALQRSKSDFGPRAEDHASEEEIITEGWGARHGFDDHYASEEYVTQLASVGITEEFGVVTATNNSSIELVYVLHGKET